MIHIPDKTTVYFDVDDTLVLWDPARTWADESAIAITGANGNTLWLAPHWPHIYRLRQHKQQGNNVIVWSQGGSDWAKTVIEALGLTDYVDLCLTKPHKFYDDLDDPRLFMGQHEYLSPQES